MDSRVIDLVGMCAKCAGASQPAIARLNEWTGYRLPECYLELLAHANGIEGFVGEQSYLILWPAEELRDLNEAYGFTEHTPHLFLFGSNGGDAGYAFDLRSADRRVVEVPFVDLKEVSSSLGSSLREFLEELKRR